jgi:hypothetical protein
MSGTPDENTAIVKGGIAYFGTYSIDEATHVLTAASVDDGAATDQDIIMVSVGARSPRI